MRTSFWLLVFILVLGFDANARLGESREELDKRYGTPAHSTFIGYSEDSYFWPDHWELIYSISGGWYTNGGFTIKVKLFNNKCETIEYIGMNIAETYKEIVNRNSQNRKWTIKTNIKYSKSWIRSDGARASLGLSSNRPHSASISFYSSKYDEYHRVAYRQREKLKKERDEAARKKELDKIKNF